MQVWLTREAAQPLVGKTVALDFQRQGHDVRALGMVEAVVEQYLFGADRFGLLVRWPNGNPLRLPQVLSHALVARARFMDACPEDLQEAIDHAGLLVSTRSDDLEPWQQKNLTRSLQMVIERAVVEEGPAILEREALEVTVRSYDTCRCCGRLIRRDRGGLGPICATGNCKCRK